MELGWVQELVLGMGRVMVLETDQVTGLAMVREKVLVMGLEKDLEMDREKDRAMGLETGQVFVRLGCLFLP